MATEEPGGSVDVDLDAAWEGLAASLSPAGSGDRSLQDASAAAVPAENEVRNGHADAATREDSGRVVCTQQPGPQSELRCYRCV